MLQAWATGNGCLHPFGRGIRSLQIQLQLQNNTTELEQSGFWAILNQNSEFNSKQILVLSCSLWLTDKMDTDILSPEPIPDFRDTVHSPALHHSPFSPTAGKCQKMLSQQMLLITLSEAVPSSVPSPIALCPVALLSICTLHVLLQPHPCRLLSLGISLSLGHPIPILHALGGTSALTVLYLCASNWQKIFP